MSASTLCLASEHGRALADTDLEAFLKDLRLISTDHGLTLNSIGVRCGSFQISTSDPATFGKLWGARPVPEST